MMTEQHTAWPWFLGEPGGPTGQLWSIVNAQGRVIAVGVVREIDARLLVAAPDLLSACRWSLEHIQPLYQSDPGNQVVRHTYENLISAIRKATGEGQT